MGENGTYIEKNINDIEQIKVAISDWWDKKNEQELFLLVVCENRSRVAQISGLSSILDYYGEDYKDWKPFEGETILELISKFCNGFRYNVKCVICNGFEIEDMLFWVNLEDNHLHKLIIITDGLALSETTIRFASSIDHRNKVGGIIVPLHEDIGKTEKVLIRSLFQQKYPRMETRSSGNLAIPYPNIETNVSTKKEFMKKIIDLSGSIGIHSKPKSIFDWDGAPAGIGELKNDG
jgi:hypothetical protein